MALKNAGDPLGLTEYNHNLQLGYNKTDSLGDKEVRMKKSTYFYLVTDDSGEVKVGLLPADVLARLNAASGAIDGSLFDWWYDNNSALSDNPYFEIDSNTWNAATAITFNATFNAAPLIVHGLSAGNYGAGSSTGAITTTGFQGSVVNMANANTARTVHHLAMGQLP